MVYTGSHDNDSTLGWWAAMDEAQRASIRDYLHSDGREIHWEWRFTWEQVRPEHAQRLAHLGRLYRRDGTPLQA